MLGTQRITTQVATAREAAHNNKGHCHGQDHQAMRPGQGETVAVVKTSKASHLDDADAVGDLKGVVVAGEAHVSLLQAVGAAHEQQYAQDHGQSHADERQCTAGRNVADATPPNHTAATPTQTTRHTQHPALAPCGATATRQMARQTTHAAHRRSKRPQCAAVRRPPPMRTPHHGHTSPHVRTTRHTTCATTRCTTPRRSEPTSHADTHRMRVLTFSHSISYMPRTADLIWRLLASLSTMNTRVLLSSIFFIADSVVSG